MRVKIDNTWYDSTEQPICIQIDELEQEQIGNIDRNLATQGKYAVFPNNVALTKDEMIEFMGG
jgi:hypothetical protein